jgi:hypothetical protein
MSLSQTRLLRALLISLMPLLAAGLAAAQQRPLITEDVDIIPPGTIRVQAGLDFLQDAKFPVSGLTGDLTRVGVIGISIGVSPNVEFQIEGVAQDFLSINSRRPGAINLSLAPGANSTNDVGDFTLGPRSSCRNESGVLRRSAFASVCNCRIQINRWAWG